MGKPAKRLSTRKRVAFEPTMMTTLTIEQDGSAA
jgi:hypothetical protein